MKRLIWIALWLGLVPGLFAQGLVIDHQCTDLGQVPLDWISAAITDLHVTYNHTSHGSQLVSGMSSLRSFPSYEGLYDYSTNGSATELELHDRGIPGVPDLSQGDYLDAHGVTPWVTSTRTYLDNPANLEINVIMWSWCSINNHNIQRYLENMDLLVAEYGPGGSAPRAATHPVSFVYMTGHAEGQGEGGFIHQANLQIRAHCQQHDRILFDFADIESHDPLGNYYYDLPMWDDLDYNPGHTGNWGREFVQGNPDSELARLTTGEGVEDYNGCPSCSHSDSPSEAAINCILKGRACWWMFARLAGWDPEGQAPELEILFQDEQLLLGYQGLIEGTSYRVDQSSDGMDWAPFFSFTAAGTFGSANLGSVPAESRNCYRLVQDLPEANH